MFRILLHISRTEGYINDIIKLQLIIIYYQVTITYFRKKY